MDTRVRLKHLVTEFVEGELAEIGLYREPSCAIQTRILPRDYLALWNGPTVYTRASEEKLRYFGLSNQEFRGTRPEWKITYVLSLEGRDCARYYVTVIPVPASKEEMARDAEFVPLPWPNDIRELIQDYAKSSASDNMLSLVRSIHSAIGDEQVMLAFGSCDMIWFSQGICMQERKDGRGGSRWIRIKV